MKAKHLGFVLITSLALAFTGCGGPEHEPLEQESDAYAASEEALSTEMLTEPSEAPAETEAPAEGEQSERKLCHSSRIQKSSCQWKLGLTNEARDWCRGKGQGLTGKSYGGLSCGFWKASEIFFTCC